MDEALVPKKIVMVASTEFAGGAERYIARVATQLSIGGSKVELLGDLRTWTPRAGGHFSTKSGGKWSLKRLPVGILRLPMELLYVSRATRDVGPVVFNAHFKREQVGYTRLLSRRGEVVWTEHGRFPRGVFGLLMRVPYRVASRRVKRIICVSSLVSEEIARIADPSVEVVSVDSGVDLLTFRPASTGERAAARRKWGLSGDRKVALFVGRLEAEKRPMLAVKGALLAGCDVVVAGTGSEVSRLKRQYGDDPRVHLVGETDEVAELYRVADVHMFLSDGSGEGFPTVLLEASASGAPTVGSADCGFSKVVSEAGGVVSEVDATAVSASVVEILSRGARARAEALRWARTRGYDAFVVKYRDALLSAKAE